MLSFLIPILLFNLDTAVWVSIAWGIMILGIISYLMALDQKESPLHTIGEHLSIALIVIFITHYVGDFISGKFGAII